jgi:two-component system cell cycle response regulator
VKKRKILLIDDNDETLDLLEIFLYKQYDIIVAQNGFDGLEKTEANNPDCVIADIIMPVMDGIKFFNNLKKNEKIAHIPVIAVTSFVKKMNIKSLLNIGFSEVLSKPFKFDTVLEVVEKVIEPQDNDTN